MTKKTMMSTEKRLKKNELIFRMEKFQLLLIYFSCVVFFFLSGCVFVWKFKILDDLLTHATCATRSRKSSNNCCFWTNFRWDFGKWRATEKVWKNFCRSTNHLVGFLSFRRRNINRKLTSGKYKKRNETSRSKKGSKEIIMSKHFWRCFHFRKSTNLKVTQQKQKIM